MQAFPVIKFFYDGLYSGSNRGVDANDEVITRLKFIGFIRKGIKINVQTMSMQQPSIITSITRAFYRESKETTLDFLTTIINRSFEIVQLCLLKKTNVDQIKAKNVCEDLIRSTVGLLNIKETYKDDELFSCRIQTLIQNIEVQLNDLKENNPGLFIRETINDVKLDIKSDE